MNSKPKSIDMGSLIQKVTKRARELLKKKSKPQNKGKTANGTSRYSKSKRQKLLIGGVKVKLDKKVKDDILNIIGVKTQEHDKKQAQAHLVELLKLKTIQKIESKLVDYTIKIRDDTSKEGKINEEDAAEINKIEKILNEVGIALKLSTTEDFENFKIRQTELTRIYKESSDSTKLIENMGSVLNLENNIYEYQLFTGDIESYKLCNIEKELTTLNIFRLFYDLTKMNEDPTNVFSSSGGAFNDLYLVENVENGLKEAKDGDFATIRLKVYESLLSEVKTTIKEIREQFVSVDLVQKQDRTGITRANARSVSDPGINEASDEDLVGGGFESLNEAERKNFNDILKKVKEGGTINDINYNEDKTKEDEPFKWGVSDGNYTKQFKLYEFNNYVAVLNSGLQLTLPLTNKTFSKTSYGKLVDAIDVLNKNIEKLKNEYIKVSRDSTKINKLNQSIIVNITTIKESYVAFVGRTKYNDYRPDALESARVVSGVSYDAERMLQERTSALSVVGGNPVKYKSTGQVVHIIFQNKKYKRVIYVKDKRNTKYCKMNNEYILLSKLKVIE
jgi:hypothetical protein